MTETITYNGRQCPVVGGSGQARRNDAEHPSPPAEQPRAKYGNRYCIIGSERFDSRREGLRHLVLLDKQRNGEITDLKRQVTFRLEVNGKLIGKVRPDWTYTERGQKVAEDSKPKAIQTPSHKTRWKLAKALYPEWDWRIT